MIMWFVDERDCYLKVTLILTFNYSRGVCEAPACL